MHVQIVNFQLNGIDVAAIVPRRPDAGADETPAIEAIRREDPGFRWQPLDQFTSTPEME